MKLISLNVCIKIDNSKKVAEFLDAQNPDIVALQEVMRHFDEEVFDMYKSKANIEKIIGKKLPHAFFGPLWITKLFMKDGLVHRDFGGFVEQGNEILSKFPIAVGSNEHYYNNYSTWTDVSKFRKDDHSRAVLIAELDVDGKPLRIINLHGLYSEDKLDTARTLHQSEVILEILKRKDIPTIIAGDFNLFPNTKSIQMINEKMRNLISEYKIKSTRPDFDDGLDTGNNVVDYIFVNDKIKVNDFKVIDTDVSDHLPLVLDFDILD
jgi:endonuclease/exonuclease/phosphatase family metal-dependent hydrolase